MKGKTCVRTKTHVYVINYKVTKFYIKQKYEIERFVKQKCSLIVPARSTTWSTTWWPGWCVDPWTVDRRLDRHSLPTCPILLHFWHPLRSKLRHWDAQYRCILHNNSTNHQKVRIRKIFDWLVILLYNLFWGMVLLHNNQK